MSILATSYVLYKTRAWKISDLSKFLLKENRAYLAPEILVWKNGLLDGSMNFRRIKYVFMILGVPLT